MAKPLQTLDEPLEELVRTRVTKKFKKEILIATVLAKERDYSDFVRDTLRAKVDELRLGNPAFFEQFS